MTVRAKWIVLGVVLASCTRAVDPPPTSPPGNRQRTTVAREFAEAMVSDDFETQGSLVCPGPILRDPFPFDEARIAGPPTAERPSGAVTIEPPPDLFVPFAATENGAEIGGAIEMSFGAGDCVQTYAVSRAI